MSDKLIIRANTFRQWFKANFSASQIRDIAKYGADAGWNHLTYTSDYIKIFDKFSNEIWEMAAEDAKLLGYAAERVARELCDD